MCAPLNDHEAPVCTAPEETMIFVGKHRPLSAYPAWARLVVRFAYWLTDYSDGQESAGIARTWEEAEALAAERPDGYFGHELPVGSLLPDEPCQLKPTVFFKTDSPDFYKHYKPRFVAVPTREFHQLGERLESLSRRSAKTA